MSRLAALGDAKGWRVAFVGGSVICGAGGIVKKTRHADEASLKNFKGLGEIALFDHLERTPESQPLLQMAHWQKLEIENYVCTREILLQYAFDPSGSAEDDLVQRAEGRGRRQAMEAAIARTEAALIDLNKGSPWDAGFKVSDDFLAPLFATFYRTLKLSNTMLKTNFHRIAAVLHKDEVHPEVIGMLDAIVAQATLAG